MPEGHTIHRIAMDQTRTLRGHPVATSSPQGRFADGAALIDGSVLEGIEAWGKHLFYDFGAGAYLHVHLGLYGKFWPWSPPPAPTHRQVRVRLWGPAAGYDLTGPTACEVIDPVGRQAIVDRLGPDPLRKGADPDRAWTKLARRRGPVGVALMDQGVVAGVGNVFRAEALFVHGIHPERPGSTLQRTEWDELWSTLATMLRAGVKRRRIVTVDPHDPCIDDGRQRYVYKQERCARCGTPVRRWDLAGRWAYACETCQPPWTG